MIAGPENKASKQQQPLSLPSANGENDAESLFNSLSFVDNLSRETKSPAAFTKDTNSNPFVNFVSENNTNPFHDCNPFLSNNPFRIDEVDSSRMHNGAEDNRNNNKEVWKINVIGKAC